MIERICARGGRTTCASGSGQVGSWIPATDGPERTRTGTSCVTKVFPEVAEVVEEVVIVRHSIGVLSEARLVSRSVASEAAAHERRALRKTTSGTSRLITFSLAEAIR